MRPNILPVYSFSLCYLFEKPSKSLYDVKCLFICKVVGDRLQKEPTNR